jgi:hypothetical protein
MAFYIVVHHPADPNRLWANDWDENSLLRSITTPKEVALRCAIARARGERIFVHRCVWDGFLASIWCSVMVSKVQHVDRTMSLIQFTGARLIDLPPLVVPHQGQNCYDALPPMGHQ